MNIVGHQGVGVQRAFLFPQRLTQPVETGVIVLFAEEGWCAVVPALHEVQRYAIEVYAGTSWHNFTVAKKLEPGRLECSNNSLSGAK